MDKIYIISTGNYMCSNYRAKEYTSLSWLWKKLKSLNYPYDEIFQGADWNNYSKHYTITIV